MTGREIGRGLDESTARDRKKREREGVKGCVRERQAERGRDLGGRES